MKVIIAGDSPMERLTNFTKKLVAVPKAEIVARDKQLKSAKKRAKRKRAPA